VDRRTPEPGAVLGPGRTWRSRQRERGCAECVCVCARERRESLPRVKRPGSLLPSSSSSALLLSSLTLSREPFPVAACTPPGTRPVKRPSEPREWLHAPFLFFITLVTGPRRSLSLKLSDAKVYEPQRGARLGAVAGAGRAATRVPPPPARVPVCDGASLNSQP